MVCIPCIILPAALWFYMKFLQPFILRWMPPTWRTWLDNWLYPTCPVKPPPSKAQVVGDEIGNKDEKGNECELKRRNVGEGGEMQKTCCGAENGKSPSSILEQNGHVAVGGPDKKSD